MFQEVETQENTRYVVCPSHDMCIEHAKSFHKILNSVNDRYDQLFNRVAA